MAVCAAFLVFQYHALSETCVAGISLIFFFRYALGVGAAAIAVDIEDTADLDRRSGGKSAIKILPHTVQRRGETGSRKKDQTS